MAKTKKPARAMNAPEAKAKKLALEYERQRISDAMGPTRAADVIEIGEGDGHEIASPDGRTIEVKGSAGTKPNHGFVINSQQEVDHLMRGGHIYRIIDVDGNPCLYDIVMNDLNITPRFRADVRIRKDCKTQAIPLKKSGGSSFHHRNGQL